MESKSETHCIINLKKKAGEDTKNEKIVNLEEVQKLDEQNSTSPGDE